ncbi:MAG: hypothetical protein IM584_08030 [Chitinophagaceae bacterium]|nr:hypothetical protein [Chitinophagaceae bacterium]MCA6451672.1 hypothetical protein [Chitinophagaceae bacterium]MCA6456065.1 hypothetical protein [Chitinophagaceae bacterium]MCA6459777.1 hypothetical protein [Chitinophagaceae bacterium]MCA6465886.1 hypothetical protein [Chitinophagaceae bacterium]
MKARLNLTIEDSLLENVKNYAAKQQQSVSELVEGYFKTVTKPSKRKNILHLVEKLDKPVIAEEADLKELYYKENAKKYGF